MKQGVTMEVRIKGNEKILYPEGRISADTVNEFEKEILNILFIFYA